MTIAKKLHILSVSTIVRKLMDEHRITESELARRAGLPQTTINRLLLGGTSDPRANTLKSLADVFKVTIGQLCGFEPLALNQSSQYNAWHFIPIITWEQVRSWTFTKKNTTPLQHKHWISTERSISDNSFALYSLAFMEPRFRKNSIIIVDPNAEYKDGHFVIVALDGIHPTVRKILTDGPDILLKPFDQTQPAIKFSKKHTIYGTIVESRMDTYHE